MHEPPETGWEERAWRSPSIAVAVLDEDSRITRTNDTFRQLVGEGGEPVPTLISHVCDDHRHLVRPLLERPASGGPVRVGMFPNADGIPIDVELSLSIEDQHRSVFIEPLLGPPIRAMSDVMRLNEKLGETQRQLQTKNLALETALREAKESHLYIRKLEGILPMCMNCKSVRDDQDDWTTLDTYLLTSDAVEVSHGLCPSCEKAALEELEADA